MLPLQLRDRLRAAAGPPARRLPACGAWILAALAGAAAARPVPGRVIPFLLAFGAAFGAYALACALVLGRPRRGGPVTPGAGAARASASVAGPAGDAAPAAGPAGDAVPAAGPAGRAVVAAVMLFAVLFRLVFLFLPPVLSTDLHRYVWDGRALLAGFNPYRHAPADPALEPLRAAAPYDRLDHREVRSIYPPAAQLLFAAGAPGGATGVKSLVVAADVAAIACLARLLRRRGLPPARALLYAWNPLVIVEVAWSGHVEPAGVALLLVGAAAIIQKRPVRGALAVAGAGLVKVLPWALLIPLWRRFPPRAVAAAAALGLAAYWPFRGAGPALASGLGEYARRWEGNGALFPVVRAAIAALDPVPWLKEAIAFLHARLPAAVPVDLLYPWAYPPALARGACALLALAAALWVARRVADPLRAIYLTIGAALLLSPTMHPWYLLWIIPWLAFFPSRAWLLLTGLAPLTYLNLGAAGDVPPHPWVPLAVYLPFAVLALRDRRRGGRSPLPDPGDRLDPESESSS